MTPLLCFKGSVSCEEVSKFSQDGDDSIEVEDKGGADEGDGEGEELDLNTSLRSDISVAYGGGCDDEFVEDDIVLGQAALLVSQGIDLISQHHHTQE